MILRAAFALSLVLLITEHEPDIGLGRPEASVPFTQTSDVSRCNQNAAWLCFELHYFKGWRDSVLAGANRVRDDLNSRHDRRTIDGRTF